MSNQKTLGIALAVGFGIVLSFQTLPGKDRKVEAESFVLKDEKGRIRALFTASGNSVGMAFRDSDGKLRAYLSVNDNGGSSLSMKGKDFMSGISIRASDVETSMMLTGENRISMSTLLGLSQMIMTDTNGDPAAGFIMQRNGNTTAYGIDAEDLFERMLLMVPEQRTWEPPECSMGEPSGLLNASSGGHH